MDLIKRGTNFSLWVALDPERDDRFVRAQIYSGSTIIETVNLPNIGNAIYKNETILANTTGIFFIKYKVFKDNGFTRPDKRYKILSEEVRVEEIVDELTETIDLADGTAV